MSLTAHSLQKNVVCMYAVHIEFKIERGNYFLYADNELKQNVVFLSKNCRASWLEILCNKH